jgi:PAS domain S-box-containing protein
MPPADDSSLAKRIWQVQTDAMSPSPGLGDALLATASDAIIATDRGGLVTFWNPGAERIFGFSSAEAVGQSLDLIIPENLRNRHWDGYHRAMETGESRYGHGDLLSVPGLTKDGRRISVEFTIVMLRDAHNRPAGTAAILRDVTKRFEETRKLKRELADSLSARPGPPQPA